MPAYWHCGCHAQFEKGKWFVNPSITGLNLSYNTETDKAHFGLEAKGGAFLMDNVALLIDAGAKWQGGGTDVYTWVWADVIISTK